MLELRRRGYRDVRRPLTLAEGGRSVLNVELFEDPGAPASETGTLAVSVSEDNAVLLVDGQAKTIHRDSGLAFTATRIPGLPMGPHVLRVERAGFLPAEHLVVVPGGQTTTVRVTLQPTQETHYDYVQRANAARGWAVAAVSAGFAVALAGGTLALTRHLSLDEARRYLDEERREQEVPMNGGECDRSLALSEEMAADLRRPAAVGPRRRPGPRAAPAGRLRRAWAWACWPWAPACSCWPTATIPRKYDALTEPAARPAPLLGQRLGRAHRRRRLSPRRPLLSARGSTRPMATSKDRFDTRLIHAGEPEPRIDGAVEMPIFQSAMF